LTAEKLGFVEFFEDACDLVILSFLSAVRWQPVKGPFPDRSASSQAHLKDPCVSAFNSA
jgi:hypothetical protein